MKRTKRTALCALMLAALLCLTGCAGNEQPKTDTADSGQNAGFVPALDPQIKGTRTVAGHYDNFEALEEEFNRFEAYYPNVQLTYTMMDSYSKGGSRVLSTALNGSEAPDIFFTYPWMRSWEDGAEILAASENLADPAAKIDLTCIRGELLKKEENGDVLSVPIYTTTYGMLVNEDIFAKENIAVPQTYSALVEACKKLKDAGYTAPILGHSQNDDLLYALSYPYLCASIRGNETALAALNGMQPGAGEYLRGALGLSADFMAQGVVDLAQCDALENNYDAVILRFFEGDVPMMLATGNTVSGTKKREAKSDAFTAHPFKYNFYPVPSTEEGGYFINNISVGFGVNKDSANLALANEFMRFLVNPDELNRMAEAKRMVPPCTAMSLDSVYAPFGGLSDDRRINLGELGLSDAASSQAQKADCMVITGAMSVDEAVAAYGEIE